MFLARAIKIGIDGTGEETCPRFRSAAATWTGAFLEGVRQCAFALSSEIKKPSRRHDKVHLPYSKPTPTAGYVLSSSHQGCRCGERCNLCGLAWLGVPRNVKLQISPRTLLSEALRNDDGPMGREEQHERARAASLAIGMEFGRLLHDKLLHHVELSLIHI